jgi:hypothetical protein
MRQQYPYTSSIPVPYYTSSIPVSYTGLPPVPYTGMLTLVYQDHIPLTRSSVVYHTVHQYRIPVPYTSSYTGLLLVLLVAGIDHTPGGRGVLFGPAIIDTRYLGPDTGPTTAFVVSKALVPDQLTE